MLTGVSTLVPRIRAAEVVNAAVDGFGGLFISRVEYGGLIYERRCVSDRGTGGSESLGEAHTELLKELANLRLAQKLSQKLVAEGMGVSQPTVAAFEHYDRGLLHE